MTYRKASQATGNMKRLPLTYTVITLPTSTYRCDDFDKTNLIYASKYTMDPFSITAGAVGIAAFATSSIVQLHNLINSLPEADGLVADISSQLTNIERPLAALQQLGISNESMEDLKKAGVPEAVEACNNACDEFEKKLAKWTSRSNTKKLSFRDRFTVGVVKKEQMRTLMTRLDSCGNTVQLAVESTQL
jgi:hypothetical protein